MEVVVPSLRAIGSSVLAGVAVLGVLALWLRLPTFVAVALAALMGVLFLILTASIEADSLASDAAWRAASPDLIARAPEDLRGTASPVVDPAAGEAVSVGQPERLGP
ncbi:MAG TPA: hypothetical protein VIV06_08335 [Candidatus Limnocylindrales bacterium]